MIKKLLSSVMVSVGLLSVLISPSLASAETFEIFGSYVTGQYDKSGNITEQVVMYPLRRSSDKLGCIVNWSGDKAIVSTGGKSYVIYPQSNKVYDSAGSYIGELKLAPNLTDGHLYVDLSFFTDVLGLKISDAK